LCGGENKYVFVEIIADIKENQQHLKRNRRKVHRQMGIVLKGKQRFSKGEPRVGNLLCEKEPKKEPVG